MSPKENELECAYELYVMTRAVADLAVASRVPTRLASVRERVDRQAGRARAVATFALEDALRHMPDREMTEFCGLCGRECPHE